MPIRAVKKTEANSTILANPNNRKVNTKKGKELVKEGASPLTIVRVEEAAKMISKGKGRNEVIEYIQKAEGLSYDQARNYFIAACRFLIPDDPDFRQSLINQNIERLEKIITDNMETQPKVAREAIAELNKMLGVGGNSVQIGVHNDKDGNQEFIIKIDQ